MDKGQIGRYLKEKGLMPSVQRIEVYFYLLGNKMHPTADIIFREISEIIPSLSKTTVYNTLKLFVEKGLVSELRTDKSEARYDADVTKHGHFKCRGCLNIYDFEISMNELNNKSLDGFIIEGYQLNVSGLCKECMEIE